MDKDLKSSREDDQWIFQMQVNSDQCGIVCLVQLLPEVLMQT